MQILLHFFVDELGFRRAEAKPSDGILGCHLSGDHMRPEGCDWTLAEINKIKKNGGHTHMGGNAALAEIDQDKVLVVPTWDDEPRFECQLALEEYEKIIIAWKHFLISREPREILCEVMNYTNTFDK